MFKRRYVGIGSGKFKITKEKIDIKLSVKKMNLMYQLTHDRIIGCDFTENKISHVPTATSDKCILLCLNI